MTKHLYEEWALRMIYGSVSAMNLKYVRVYFVLSLFLLTSIFFSTISARASTTNIVENEFTAEFSPLGGDDGTAVNMYDAVNRSELRTGFTTWKEDWGEEDVPKGIYVGTAFAPAVLDTGIQRVYRRCVFEVSFTVNFSAKEIMNGASSFWVKVPMAYDDKLFNVTNFDEPYYLPSTLQSFINDFLIYASDTVLVDSSIYLRFDYIITPNTNYTFTFRVPFFYWDVSLISSNGYYEPSITPKLLLTDEKVYEYDNSNYAFLTSNNSFDIYGTTNMSSPDYADYDGVSSFALPPSISLGYSFIFSNGIGLGGLFGKSYPVTNYTSVYTKSTSFIMMTKITHNNTSGDYVSIMIPFYSITPIHLVRAFIEIWNPLHGKFASVSTSDSYTISNNYSGFFLFTFPLTLTTYSPPNEGIPAVVVLAISNSLDSLGSITFLHTSNNNISSVNVLGDKSGFYANVSLYNDYDFVWGLTPTTYSDLDVYNYIYYDFICYAETTGEKWAWIWHNATGGIQYDYVFRQKIYVPITIYTITNGDTGATVYRGIDGNAYKERLTNLGLMNSDINDDGEEDWITTLAKSIKTGIMSIHNGLKKAYGYIMVGLQEIAKGLYRLGELVINSFMKFWGVLESIVAFIEDNVLNILELLVATASAFLFLLIMPVVSRSFKSFFAHVGGNV